MQKERSLTLREIDAELVAAMEAVDEAKDSQEEEVALSLVRAWAEAELVKVDRVRDFIKHCGVMSEAANDEMCYQAARRDQWKDRAATLKSICRVIMEQRGIKRLNGNTGDILLKGNGGRPPVVINNKDLVPDEMCDVQFIHFTGSDAVKAISEWVRTAEQDGRDVRVAWVRVPSLRRIGDALADGIPVAGCHLAERGAHVEVK